MKFKNIVKVVALICLVLIMHGCCSNKLASIQTTLEKKGALKFKVSAIVELGKLMGDRKGFTDAALEKPLRLSIEYLFADDSMTQQNTAQTFLSAAQNRPELFKQVSNDIFLKLQPPGMALDRFALERLAKAFKAVNDNEPFRYFAEITEKLYDINGLYNYSVFMNYGETRDVFEFFVTGIKRLFKRKKRDELWTKTLDNLITGLGIHGVKVQDNQENSRTAHKVLRAIFYMHGAELSRKQSSVSNFKEALGKVLGDRNMSDSAFNEAMDATSFEVVSPITEDGKEW
jgi:hypothetical protein